MKKLILLSLISGLMVVTNCKKDVIDNEASLIFWYDLSVSTNLRADNAISLVFYVDGEIVGSMATSVYWTGSPSCGVTGSITVKKLIGNVDSKPFNYSIKDQTGHVYWSGIVNFEANKCTALQLTW